MLAHGRFDSSGTNQGWADHFTREEPAYSSASTGFNRLQPAPTGSNRLFFVCFFQPEAVERLRAGVRSVANQNSQTKGKIK